MIIQKYIDKQEEDLERLKFCWLRNKYDLAIDHFRRVYPNVSCEFVDDGIHFIFSGGRLPVEVTVDPNGYCCTDKEKEIKMDVYVADFQSRGFRIVFHDLSNPAKSIEYCFSMLDGSFSCMRLHPTGECENLDYVWREFKDVWVKAPNKLPRKYKGLLDMAEFIYPDQVEAIKNGV